MSKRTLLKLAVGLWCTLPALDLLRVLYQHNPHFIRAYDYAAFRLAIDTSGIWAVIFLLLVLACSPVQRIPGLRWVGSLRRTLGLAAFGQSLFHLLVYFVIGQKMRWDYLLPDAWLRPSRIPGWIALLLLAPLAATSTDAMVRRLGGQRWKWLHRTLYVSVALALLHVYWSEQEAAGDSERTKKFTIVFGALMALRLLPLIRSWFTRRKRDASAQQR